MPAATDPQVLFDSLFAFLKTGIVKAAVDLELFTHISRGRHSAADIATAAGADPRGVRILLDALSALGLVAKEGTHYGLSPVAEMFLVKGTPSYTGAFTRITANPRLWQAVGQLTEIARSGKPPESVVSVPEHEFWVEFSEASEQTSRLPAQAVAEALDLEPEEPAEILDVAAGSGTYGFTVLERFPKARLMSLDWHNVLEQARKVAERRGVADRVRWLPGSAFDTPLPRACFDAVVISHFYHHFSPVENAQLTERLFEALKPGGRLAVHEFIPDDARAESERSLLFGVIMLASTERGDVYTFPEYRSLLDAAGFIDVALREIPLVGSSLILARKPG
jgi:SAM-dependent methyltransferase